MGAQLWVAYSPCGSQHKDAVQITLEQIDLIKRLMADYPHRLELVTKADDLVRVHQAGRIAGVITIESGHSMGTSLSVLRCLVSRMYYSMYCRICVYSGIWVATAWMYIVSKIGHGFFLL